MIQHAPNYHLLPRFEEDRYRLLFPLHKGTLNYLNREKPTFLERYGPSMAFILSVTLLGWGYFVEKIRGNQRLKKRKQSNNEQEET